MYKMFDELSNFEIVELSKTDDDMYQLVDKVIKEKGIIKVDYPGDVPTLHCPKEKKEYYYYVEDINYGFKDKADLNSFMTEFGNLIKDYEDKMYYCGYDKAKPLSEKSYYFIKSNIKSYKTEESLKALKEFENSTASELHQKDVEEYNIKLAKYKECKEKYDEIELEVYDKCKSAWAWVDLYNSYHKTLLGTYEIVKDWTKTAEIVKLNNKGVEQYIFETVIEDLQKSSGEVAATND